MLQCIRHARQQVEVWQELETNPYNLKRLYPATEEGAEQLIEEVITTTQSPLSHCHSHLTLVLDINSIHEEEETLVDLLGSKKIPMEISLVFLLPEIQTLYQAHQIVQWEAQSHSLEFSVRFALETNGRERSNRYRMPTPYLRCCTRQRKVYIADKRKKRYKDNYNPDLDHHYNLYLCSNSYLCTLCSYLF